MEKIELVSNEPKIKLYLPHGNSAEVHFNAYKEQVKKYHINDWDKVRYNPQTKEILGASNISAGVFNYVLKDFGLEVVALDGNDELKEVSNLTRGKYYVEFNSLCVSPKTPSYERNNGLWRKAMEIGEEKFGNVKNKFRIKGFYYMPDESEKGYGVKIIPAKNFDVVEDESLRLKNGVSWFVLGWDLDLDSRVDNLAYSNDGGQVVLKGSRSDYPKFE